MISLLLGALLVAGMIALFNANRQGFRLQENIARAQESGSYALDFLVEDLRVAGYPGAGQNPLGVVHVAGTRNDLRETRDRQIGGATVAVDYVDDTLTTLFAPDARSAQVTCTGEAIPAGTAWAGNRYRVREGTAGERELVCQGMRFAADGTLLGTIGTEQAIAAGVESFQVLYGIDTSFGRDLLLDAACPPGGDWAAADDRIDRNDLPTQYVTADALAAALAYGRAAPDCGREIAPVALVRAIRVALLVRTENAVAADAGAAPESYTLLDRTLDAGNFPPLADGRIRRLYTATVALRNVPQEIAR